MDNLHNNVVRILSQSIEYNWLEPYKNKSNNNSVGSGFFINNNGLILTCCHVLVNTKKVFVEILSKFLLFFSFLCIDDKFLKWQDSF